MSRLRQGGIKGVELEARAALQVGDVLLAIGCVEPHPRRTLLTGRQTFEGLFPDGFELPKLRLLEARAFRSGITYSRYGRA